MFDSDWASPPGDTITDLLEERDWSLEFLAEKLNLTEEQARDLLVGKLAITPELALQLEQVLGSTAAFWLNREAQYRAKI